MSRTALTSERLEQPRSTPNLDDRALREREFWDQHVPSLEECLVEYRRGPDTLAAAMIAELGDIEGRHILDFACGAGVTSLWLAAAGAHVTALDVSGASVERCAELSRILGLEERISTVASGVDGLDTQRFDGIAGHFALHHVDCWDVAPKLAARLRRGAIAAFVENFHSNPLFRFSRRYIAGRFGVPRYGSLDEHPLRPNDLDALRSAFGHVRTEVLRMAFLRILDRQVLHFRFSRASRVIGAMDDRMGSVDSLAFLSYHRLVVCGPLGGR